MARKIKRSRRDEQDAAGSRRRVYTVMGLVGLVLLIVGGWYVFTQRDGGVEAAHEHSETAEVVDHVHGQAIEMPHLHGMGYSPDGDRLYVAVHDGLRVFVDGEWLIPDVPRHDYMGYSPIDEGFYSSGHPAPGSGLVNPLGLVKSTDGGKTLVKLGFEGESDFHLMGAGYGNHAIYVFNPAANSRLAPGFHYTLDEGATWQQSRLAGVEAQPIQVAVHPTEPNIVALASEGGLLLSTDHGDTFRLIGERRPVTAAAFAPDGENLYFGYQTLYRYDLAAEEITALEAPGITGQDGIAYLAMNPTDAREVALATFERNVYISEDAGESWRQIAREGQG